MKVLHENAVLSRVLVLVRVVNMVACTRWMLGRVNL